MTYTCRGMQTARSSAVVKFFIFIASLNLGLGFAAAMYLGRRYRWLQLLSVGRPSLPPAATRSVPAVRPARETAAVAPTAAADDAHRLVRRHRRPPAPRRSGSSTRRSNNTTFRWRRSTSSFVNVPSSPRRDTVEACLQELLAATEEYVTKRDAAQRKVQQAAAESARPKAAYDAVDAAIGQETRQIEATTAAVAAFDYDSDLSDGCRQLVEQTDLLLETNLALRNTLVETADGARRPGCAVGFEREPRGGHRNARSRSRGKRAGRLVCRRPFPLAAYVGRTGRSGPVRPRQPAVRPCAR